MAELENSSFTFADSHTPANLLELKINLLDELQVLEKAKTAAELDVNSSDITELKNSVAELKNQLLEESNAVSLREVIIKQLERHPLLTQVLFRQDQDERDSILTSKCLDDLSLVFEIMRTQEEIKAVQEKYEKMKLDNIRIKHENTVLMEKLNVEKEKVSSGSELVSRNKDYKLLKSELDVRIKSLTILKSIIPRLAISAGLNNPEIQDLILQCGEQLNL